MKIIKTAALFALLMGLQQPLFAQSTDAGHQGHEQHPENWPGVYIGMLPCADCDRIKTSLALNAKGTYILMTQNVGKSLREYTEKGTFSWADSGNVIILTTREGKVSRRYAVSDDQLTELDPATGKLSDDLILKRRDVTSKPPKHLH
jgi:copper homeostasis protein (lipoprotein)